MSRSLRSVSGLLLLLVVGCGAPDSGSGSQASEEATPTPLDPTPTPGPTPTPAGRISGLHLWKDGCSSELWGRWHSGDDYALDLLQVLTEAGDTVASVTYDDLTFRGGMDEVWRFFDQTSFPDERYRVRFFFGDGTEHEETLDLDPDFFAGPALLTPGTVLADGPGGGLAVYASSTFGGSVQRVMVYDTNRCRVHWKVFYTEPQLGAGSTTRLDIGSYFDPGTPLRVTVEGVDYGVDYTYYTSFDITVP